MENTRQVSIQPVESLHVWIEREAIWYAARDAAASAIRAGDRPEPAARDAVRDLLSRQAMEILDGLRPLPSSQAVGSEMSEGKVPRRNAKRDHWALRVAEGLGRGTVWLARIASAVLLLVAWRFVLEAGYVADEEIDAVPIRTVQVGETVGRTREALRMPCEDRTCVTDPNVRDIPVRTLHVGDLVCHCPDCGCTTASWAAAPRRKRRP